MQNTFHYLRYMQSYVIGKTMQDILFPTSDMTNMTQAELMSTHIKRYSEYLNVYKLLTKKVRHGANFTWITISVKTSTKPRAFFTAVAKFVEKKYVEDWFYVFEQRSEQESTAGCGLHCHMVASYKKYLYLDEFKRNVFRHFAAFATTAAVWIKYIKEEFIANRVNYMSGDKFEKKLMKVSIDRIWRQSLKPKIEDYYTNNFNFFIEHGKAREHTKKNDDEEGDSKTNSEGDAK